MADVLYFNDGIVLPCCPTEDAIGDYSLLSSTTSPADLSSHKADNLISQGGTQASFTFNLPYPPFNGQISNLTFNNAITTLTIDGGGKTINGVIPGNAAIGDRIYFKFYSIIDAWIVST